MARVGVLRPRKDGNGMSMCYAAEENVGKRRCCHVMSDASIQVQQVGDTNFINIDGQINKEDVRISIEASTTKLKNYMESLSQGLDTKERKKIIRILRSGNLLD